MKKVLSVASLVLALVMGSMSAWAHNVEQMLVPAPVEVQHVDGSALSIDDVHMGILNGAKISNWSVMSDEPNVVRLKYASAKQRSANAVIDIVSYYKKDTQKNDTTFQCHAGSFVAGVTLKGTYAKVAN